MRNVKGKPAIYLDRDGVIIYNRADYIRGWDQVKFLPRALDSLARLSQLPFFIVVVTNQSAVGRGLLAPETAAEINQRLVDVISRRGGRIDAVLMCPHAPESRCTCRKPAPGMLIEAAVRLNIDLARSFMVGDALSDLQAGQAAGVAGLALLLTGRGEDQRELLPARLARQTRVFPDLWEFTQDFIQEDAKLTGTEGLSPGMTETS